MKLPFEFRHTVQIRRRKTVKAAIRRTDLLSALVTNTNKSSSVFPTINMSLTRSQYRTLKKMLKEALEEENNL